MEIKTKLLVDDVEIIEGLRSGKYQRFGGVVRDASTGRIVRHLMESPGGTESLMSAPPPALLKGESAPLGILGGDLTRVMGLSQVAAAASVLNLGVSIVGFTYMGYKLDQMRKALDSIQESICAGFAKVEDRLDNLSGHLAYLTLLVEHNTAAQKRLKDALTELHRLTLVRELADLYSAVLNRSRFSEIPAREIIPVASRVRMVMADQAVRLDPEMEPHTLLIVDVATQGWAVAIAAEAYVLLEIGRAKEARNLLAFESARFNEHSRRWARALLADERPQLATAYRFSIPRLRKYILPERVQRIADISPYDTGLSWESARRKQKDAELEMEMSYAAKLGESWEHRQVAIAEYLDGLSELSARIESLKNFAEFCEERGVKSTDILPGPDAPPGIFTLPASTQDMKR